MNRIQVELMKGCSLDSEECRILGMDDAQIEKLRNLVDESVGRWRERETKNARIIPAGGPDRLIHVPSVDPAVAEAEWLEIRGKVAEIGGEGLAGLLCFRLTDGYSPSRQSNSPFGLLNMLTGGFGTLDRFIRIKALPRGGQSYEVSEVLPEALKGHSIDEGIFPKLGDAVRCERTSMPSGESAADRFSHLPHPTS